MCLISTTLINAYLLSIYGVAKTIVTNEDVCLCDVAVSETGVFLNQTNDPTIIYMGQLFVSFYQGSMDVTGGENLECSTFQLLKEMKHDRSLREETSGDYGIVWRKATSMLIPFHIFNKLSCACDTGSVEVSYQFIGKKLTLAP